MDKESEKDRDKPIDAYPEGCRCHKQRIDNLCQARDVGIERFVECLEEDPHECPYSMLIGHVHYCKYPLRILIAKKKNH